MSLIEKKKYGPINTWDISLLDDLSYLFGDTHYETYHRHIDNELFDWMFNEDISNWNVTNVKNMEGLFMNLRCFNHPLNDWDVSNVENMSNMFAGCQAFDQPLDKWNVSKVTNMSRMFGATYAFYGLHICKFNHNINNDVRIKIPIVIGINNKELSGFIKFFFLLEELRLVI